MSITVYRDPWGIPHLRADSAHELAFAQGCNAARDRAWQIEVERHRALGTTAAFLGPDAIGWDRFARRVRLADTAKRCFARLGSETAAWVSRYADGVNAGLAAGARQAPEFAATGLVPGRWEPWTPLAIWLTHHILFAGFPAKLWRWAVAERIGPEAVGLFATDGPGTLGSNGWLIPGDRTATGAALIAGDPHRLIEEPGVYQQIRLSCPEFDVAGFAVPGVPGIPHFGHTGRVAWAITNAMSDYQDLYRERLRRRAGRVEALGPDGWRPAEAHVEIIEVAGGDRIEVEVIETERGPVVLGGPDDAQDGLPPGEALSLRYPPRVRHDLGFDALPALLRAATVADVDRALDRWAEPVNVVLAADTAGGLLHRVAGAVPIRDPENRLWPVPAWERGYEWSGWHAPMPRRPVRGITVMANERGISEPFGVEFSPRYRADRIRYLLDRPVAWSAEDMAAVHMDTHLASAGPLLDLLAGLGGLSEPAARLRDRLLAWDRRMEAASTDATAYAAVRAAVVRRLAAHPALARLGEPVPYPLLFRPWLEPLARIGYALETLLTTDRLPGLDRDAVAELVRAAVEEVAAAGSPSVPWGEAHRIAPWRALPDPEPGDRPGVSGDHECVLCTSSVPGVTDTCARGPVARYVWDLARRENSRWVVPFGASGVPGHPHQRDQLPLWLRGELIPVLTDWDRLTEERYDD